MAGGGDDRDTEQWAGVQLGAWMLEPAAAFGELERAALRHEDLLHLDVLRAGADHAHRIPGVDDLVVALRHHAKAPVDGRFAVVAIDGDGEHVPVAVVHAGGERPAAAHLVTTVDLLAAARGERD